jgi:hypothetical protein
LATFSPPRNVHLADFEYEVYSPDIWTLTVQLACGARDALRLAPEDLHALLASVAPHISVDAHAAFTGAAAAARAQESRSALRDDAHMRVVWETHIEAESIRLRACVGDGALNGVGALAVTALSVCGTRVRAKGQSETTGGILHWLCGKHIPSRTHVDALCMLGRGWSAARAMAELVAANYAVTRAVRVALADADE